MINSHTKHSFISLLFYSDRKQCLEIVLRTLFEILASYPEVFQLLIFFVFIQAGKQILKGLRYSQGGRMLYD